MSDVYIAGSLRHTSKEWWCIYEKNRWIGWALRLNIPIICLTNKNVDITSMVLGPVYLG